MSTGSGIRAKPPEIKAAYIIMARHMKSIVKTLRILPRAMRIKSQPTTRRAMHPKRNPIRTTVNPRVDSLKVPM